MSFYEGRRASAAYGDVHQPVTAPAASPASHVTSALPPDVAARLRKGSPVEVLLPIGRRWLEALPPEGRPRRLVEQFPRIVNLIAMQWTDAVSCPAYFNELLVDRRGGRQGFPPDVRSEIVSLRDRWFGAAP